MAHITAAHNEARRVLVEVEIAEPPVSIRKLIEFYVFSVHLMNWPDKYAGRLERSKRLIQVNRNHGREKQRFTVAHEFGHYFLHGDIEIFEDDGRDPSKEREAEANAFAAELLMPSAWVKRDFQQLRDPVALAAKYEVSREAMFYRLMELRLIK